MGRLFWKFFAFTSLAQLAAIVATASAFWVMQSRFNQALTDIDMGPGAGSRVDAAAAVLHYAGVPAFREWVDSEEGPTVLAVDAGGRDVLDRHVDATLISHAREVEAQHRGPSRVRDAVLSDGRRYLIFSVSRGPREPAGRSSGAAPPPMLPGGPVPPAGQGFGPNPVLRIRGVPPLIPSIATLLASMAAAFGLAWYVAKPVRSLRSAVNAVAGGNLNTRVAPVIGGRRDDLADLGRDFDRMADRLQASMNGQRRLLHDVSHEMRSPLARLQAAAGLIRLKYGDTDPAIDRVEDEIVRIDRLIGDLLKLSRIEAGELAGQEEAVDLQELVREVVDDANFEAQGSGRSVIWTGATPGSIRGRPEMLHGAVENVVRNALKHAPQSREIRVVTSLREPDRYIVRVIDDGPGVPEAEIAGLFTPFFRGADAPPRDGYGLGLAIARRSVEAHGGRIEARNRVGGGLEVTIDLPLAAGTLSLGARPV